ncbi:3-deoxy-manno-octulosonate cytidylyltransferase [Desulfohalovibrio reitneri]|uniref:3-deoxy-manno-octulosonate cytidylyltransferase n=1 Tax=Desulfohalovibrio reitneri TaxID=1307759 RepID=UPI0004A77527|nr:3-deoxy-manno-octulosonate cytidylyltransferase [Desulfohalovibrio reitneri]
MKPSVPCVAVVPARFASSRFPGKPLADILGRPMFWHVADRAARAPELSRVVVATDDERIMAAASEHGVEAVMTSPDHASGTDRIQEAAGLLGLPEETVVVNVQGDEPALNPAMISELVAPFADPKVRVTTLAHRVDPERAKCPDQVKVVWTASGDAMYFSRQPIPHHRDGGEEIYWGHVGMYAYRLPALARFTALPPSYLERKERLEQLRFLENGIPIRVVPTRHTSRGVDRPEDLDVVRRLISESI